MTSPSGESPTGAYVPIRSCCGRAHLGPTCPDGLTMCLVCFKRVTRDRLALLEEGDGSSVESAPIYVDMCRTCKQREDRWGTGDQVARMLAIQLEWERAEADDDEFHDAWGVTPPEATS